ncbi:uncharacterized protein LOC103981056 [Musa acuminata AAA Group]|uniref:uncharacterized protein LOC103981056 n=1 Tax=Musa acuminata AAA Group TaxID=214697 RepID=UPI0031D2BECD
MSKRERENPCRVRGCSREEGGVCGHRVLSAFERPTQQDFPPPFPQRSSRISSTLDNAPSGEILEALGVTHVLDGLVAGSICVASSQHWYRLFLLAKMYTRIPLLITASKLTKFYNLIM